MVLRDTREAYETLDTRRLYKHAERDREMKKLVVLTARLNRQMADRNISGNSSGTGKHGSRPSVFEN